VLGANQLQAFDVITKTPKFATDNISDEQAHQLTQVFKQSLKNLASEKVHGLLLHHVNDLLVPNGEKLLAAMRVLKEKGEVAKIGVSVYSGEQVDAVLAIFKPDIIQLPISIFDQRMLLDGQLERIKEAGIEIHVRSVFLQGLLLMPLNQVPKFFDPIRPLLAAWHLAVRTQGMTPTQAALSFVRDIPHIDTVLVGVEDLAQFQSCVEDFSTEAKFDASGLACNDPLYVNPSLWRVA
jgi:aryl-alcohol dehydrogenase-like predicted oxidoreductase